MNLNIIINKNFLCQIKIKEEIYITMIIYQKLKVIKFQFRIQMNIDKFKTLKLIICLQIFIKMISIEYQSKTKLINLLIKIYYFHHKTNLKKLMKILRKANALSKIK